MRELKAGAIVAFHDRFLEGRTDEIVRTEHGVWTWIAENHRRNVLLWQEEDKARRTDVPDAAIARCKRNIDVHNQRRNDAVEAIDDYVQATLNAVEPEPDVRLSSETAGAMIDRLSILSLKIHHMRLQTLRSDAGAEHVTTCRDKLEHLVAQRTDLMGCLDRALREARRGETCFPTYRQFKMYNDPELNPELYARRGREAKDANGDENANVGPGAAEVDVLIPTCERPAALAVTLCSLLGQTLRPRRIVVSDQSERRDAAKAPEVAAVLRLLRAGGCTVDWHRHLPRRGLAEQRDFLLGQARAPYALFVDDDVILEPDLIARLAGAIREQGCGFVGSAVIGLSYLDDVRPHQQHIEFWDGPVLPEQVLPGSREWERHHLHSAANLYHVQQRLGLGPGEQRLYRVAWIGGCVLFDTAKLREVGGFGFWRELPPQHCGEDVLAQLRLMARYGGCGVIPSGAYHQELPTTVTAREVDAPHVLYIAGQQ